MKMIIKKENKVLFLSLVIGLILILPLVTFAQSEPLVPCGDVDNPCDFDDLLVGINRIISWFILVGGSVAALGFAWVGFIYLTQGGNPAKRAEANQIFSKIATGFFFLLGSWLIVKLIVLGLNSGGESDAAIKFLDL